MQNTIRYRPADAIAFLNQCFFSTIADSSLLSAIVHSKPVTACDNKKRAVVYATAHKDISTIKLLDKFGVGA